MFFRRKLVPGSTLLVSAKFFIIEFDSAYLAWHFTALSDCLKCTSRLRNAAEVTFPASGPCNSPGGAAGLLNSPLLHIQQIFRQIPDFILPRRVRFTPFEEKIQCKCSLCIKPAGAPCVLNKWFFSCSWVRLKGQMGGCHPPQNYAV